MLEQRHEIVGFSSDLPVKLFIHKLGDVSRHWHRSLELLLVLEGEIDIVVDNQAWHLAADDLILINANTMHALQSKGGVLLAVQIKGERLALRADGDEIPYFSCNSKAVDNKPGYDALKTLIARMVKQGSGGGDSANYHSMAIAYQLFADRKSVV